MSSLRILQADLAAAAHQDALLALLNEYAMEPGICGKPLSQETQQRLVRDLPARPDIFVLLAMDGDTPIGCAVCCLGYSTFAARPLVNIHDLAVTASRRGEGVGQKLLEAVERQAQQRNCCKVTLEVNESNLRARALYRKFGFVGDQTDRVFFASKRLE